jgi:hypothetical protein
MTGRARIISIAIVIAASLTLASAQQQSDEEKAKRMAAAQAIVGPGPEHQLLASLAGKWDMEVKYWMSRDKPPIVIKSKSENRMILGGRFLLSESKTEGAIPVETMTLIGFDRRHKKYTTIGLDNMGTYYVTGAGPYVDSRKAIVMYGEDVDPVLGGTQTYDFVLRTDGPDKYVIEIIFKDEHHTQGKGDFKAVEIVHTRAR